MRIKHLLPDIMLLITVVLLELFVGIEFDIMVPVLPAIQEHFNLSVFWTMALLSSNFLGYIFAMFFTGALSDRYGRKNVIIWGLTLSLIGCVVVFFNVPFYIFLLGRFIQGIGITAPSILSFLIIADKYILEKQQYYMNILNGFLSAAIGFAPIIGSYIALLLKWRGNIILLFVFGLVCLLMVLFFIPKSKIIYNNKEDYSLTEIGVLFQNKSLFLLITCVIALFLPYWIFVGMSSILYMTDFGIKLEQFGYYQFSLAIIFVLASFCARIILKLKYDAIKKAIIFSNILIIFSAIFILYVDIFYPTNPVLIILSIMPFAVGQVVPCAIFYPLTLSFIPHAKGRVSAILEGGHLLICIIALQAVGYFYDHTFRKIAIAVVLSMALVIITIFYVLKNKEIMSRVNVRH